MNAIMKKRPLYVINGFIGFLFLGCCYAWGIFVVPLEAQFNYSRSQTSLAFTICIAGFSVGALIAGALARKIKYHWMMKAAAIMIGIGFFLSGFTNQIWQIYITYSVLCGVGIGLGYSCIISSVPMWYPEKSGTISGILLMGYALSTAIFGTLINILINAVGVTSTFKILGIISFVGLFASSFLINIPTVHDYEKLPAIKSNNVQQTQEVTTAKMMKKPIFYVHFLLICACGGASLGLINHASPILTEELKTTAAFAATIVSVNSIMNGISRMGWGIVFDKLGIKKTMIAAYACGLIGGILLFISILTKAIPLFVIGGAFVMFSFGGNASLIPSVVRTLFGSANFAMNYSIYNLNALVCSVVPTILGVVQISSKGYTLPLLIVLLLEGVAAGLLFLFTLIFSASQAADA